MAMAMPPSVIVLMLAPKARSVRIAVTSESGMASSVMKLARMLARKSTTTMMTKMPPSRRASIVFCTDALMKSACRNSFLLMTIPSGTVVWISSKARSSFCVTSSVLALGCLSTAMTTAGSMMGSQPGPRRDAQPVPRRIAEPSMTVPRSLTLIGVPSRTVTTVSAISATDPMRPIP